MHYSDKLLHYFHHPRHAGEFAGAMLFSEVGSVEGDQLKLFVQREGDRIIRAGFLAYGSPVILAAGEYICEWLEGCSYDEISRLTEQDVLEALTLPSLKIHIAALVVSAVKQLR